MAEDNRPIVIDPVEDPRWMTLMQAPDASVFHHPAWMRNLRDSYRYDIWACCLQDAEGKLRAGVPVATIRSRFTGDRLVSLPFSDFCEPITGGKSGLLEPLARALEEQRERMGLALEVHGAFPGLGPASSGDSFWHYTLDLSAGFEAAWGELHASKRRAVKKARREGVEVQRREDADALDAFYALQVQTRRKHGVPTQPKRFFRRLERLFEEGLGFVLLAVHDGAPVAAHVLLTFNGVMTSKYSASDERKRDLRANELLNVEAFRIACEAGWREADLGRAEKDNEGLQSFKQDLGGQARRLTYTLVPPRATGESVRRVSSVQRSLIRRAPPVFGRVVGSLVYRHFG